jgi:hypothetical protein
MVSQPLVQREAVSANNAYLGKRNDEFSPFVKVILLFAPDLF